MQRITIILALCLATAAVAQPPRTMNFQGTLADGVGTTLPDGNYNLTFRLWDADVGGVTIWTEARTVALDAGIFTVILGEVTPLVLPFDQPYWLGIQVGLDAELSPRTPLTGMPYAMNVVDGAVVQSLNGRVDDLAIVAGPNIVVNTVGNDIIISGTGALSDNDWNIAGNDLTSIPLGNVGIGVAPPQDKLHVGGNITAGTDVLAGFVRARVGTGPAASYFGGSYSGYGGEARLSTEDGFATTLLQPDVDGEGGYFAVNRNNGSAGVTIDGNYNATESARLTVSGTGSSVSIRTDLAGDTAVLLPGDAVNDLEILDEPGLASAVASSSIALTTSTAVLLSRTIVCPAAGYVYVQASLEVELNHTTGTSDFTTVGISDVATGLPSNQDHSFYLPSGAASGLYLSSVSPSGVFSVGAGSHTFYLLGSRAGAGSTADAWDMQLNCIYFPTAYGTVTSTVVGKDEADQFTTSVPSRPALSAAELDAERSASEAFVRDQVEQELATMRQELDRMQQRIDGLNAADARR